MLENQLGFAFVGSLWDLAGRLCCFFHTSVIFVLRGGRRRVRKGFVIVKIEQGGGSERHNFLLAQDIEDSVDGV